MANHTPTFGSGSGTYMAMIADELTRVGHQVCVLTPFVEQLNTNFNIEQRFVRLGTNFPSFTGHPLSATTYSDLDQAQLVALQTAWEDAFLEVRNEWEPDVTHIQHVWVLARAALSVGFKPVVTCHGSEVDFAACYPTLAQQMLPEPGNLHSVISISDYVARKATAILYGAPSCTTIPNPYKENLFYYNSQMRAATNAPHIGFVGRLVAYKRCEFFLECAASLKEKFPNLKASVIGDGPNRISLEALARELNLAETIRFFGLLDQEMLRDHYQSFDALIVPSQSEPFGLVALESVASGTPAIVARSGGLAELIHPPFILGYDPNGQAALVGTIEQMINTPYDIEFGMRANAYIQHRYSLTTYVRRLELIYSGSI